MSLESSAIENARRVAASWPNISTASAGLVVMMPWRRAMLNGTRNTFTAMLAELADTPRSNSLSRND
jgi:hypothetical protein